MTITNSAAMPYGLLVVDAMDMFTVPPKPVPLTPPVDPRVTAAGWEVVAYLVARDSAVPVQGPMVLGEEVYYGFLAQSLADKTAFVAVVRGTYGTLEWVEDADFVPVPHPTVAGGTVEAGFWNIYASMRIVLPSGAGVAGTASAAIATFVGAGSITVVGHSLGSALATYLTYDLACALGARCAACLFASPQTGNLAFVQAYDAMVQNYRLFNYVLDIVPRVPLGPQFTTLPRVTVLKPDTSEANIRANIGCNHHAVCYCAMLDYENTMVPANFIPQDQPCVACITGPETAAPTLAKVMAGIGL